MNRISSISIAFCFAFVAAWAIAGCGKGEPPVEKPKADEATVVAESKTVELSAEQQKESGIVTAPAEMKLMHESLEAPGVVASTGRGKALVTPPVGGKILTLMVQMGDMVKAGQPLAILESSELSQGWSSISEAQRERDAAAASLSQSKSEADLAQSKLEAAKANLARQAALAKAGAFSQGPLQAARTELNGAQGDLLTAQQDASFRAQQLRRAETAFAEQLISKVEFEAAKLADEQAKTAVSKAKNRAEIAKTNLDREQVIFDKGLLNAKEVQTAEAEVRSATLERKQADIRIRGAQAALENARKGVQNAQTIYRSLSGGGGSSAGRVALAAPISGVIAKLDVAKGQAVERTQALMEIENLTSVWVTCSVPEKDVPNVRAGQICSVTLVASQGRRYAGVVQVVGSHIDPKTRTLPVQCLITGAKGELRPEMFATVRISIGIPKQGVAVPEAAVLEDEGKSFVFCQDGPRFEKREIELGRKDGGFLEVPHGLKAGERVAIKGIFILSSEFKRDELKGEE